MKYLFLFLLFIYKLFAFAQQNEVDSLINLLPNLNDSLRVEILNQISWKSRNTNPMQTVLYGKKALVLARTINFSKGQTTALSFIGVGYRNIGRYDESLEVYMEAFEIAQKTNDKERVGYSFTNIANIYLLLKEYPVALENLEKALLIAKEIKNSNIEGYVYTNQARIYQEQKLFPLAIEAHEKALELRKTAKDIYGTIVTYYKLGEVYQAAGALDKALEMYEKSLKLNEIERHDLDISAIRTNLASVYMEKKQFDKAIEEGKTALRMAQSVNAALESANAAKIIYQIEKIRNNYENSLFYHEIYLAYRDSLLSLEKNKQLSELEVRFDTEQKDKENEVLRQQKLLNENTIAQQNTILVSAVTISLLFIVLIFVLYLANQKRKKANFILEAQKVQIQAQHQIVIEKNELLNQKTDNLNAAYQKISLINDELNEFNKIIAAKNQSILASITYARRIQLALLPLRSTIDQFLRENFIFFRPRDIVSGDFYWFEVFEDKIYVAAVDCTGHGVPGALLSMLGSQGLTTILHQNHVKEVGKILQSLHYFILRSLQQQQTQSYDGMDVSLVCIDKKKKEISFAGAKNPLLYIQNGAINKIKGDKIAIGGSQQKHKIDFLEHKISYKDAPIHVYLYTDGFQDQFGGENGRKLMSKNFENQLFEMHTLGFNVQENYLDAFFSDWKGKNAQVDDVLVIGVHLV